MMRLITPKQDALGTPTPSQDEAAQPSLLESAEMTKAEWLAARGDPAQRPPAPGASE